MDDRYLVAVTPRAEADLEAVAEYVRTVSSSPEAAAGVAGRIAAAINTLAVLPARYQQVGTSRAHGTPVHMLVAHPYLVYYRIEHRPAVVRVLTIRHGARRRLTRFE